MGKKKQKRTVGRPFIKGGDPRQSRGQPNVETETLSRVREPSSVYQRVAHCSSGVPPGARLRPYDDSVVRDPESLFGQNAHDTSSQNWLIDEQRLFDATNDALKCHSDSKRRRKHTPILAKQHATTIGLGLRISFRCKYKNCHFQSKSYELFEKTASGQPIPNLQLAVALTKTDITPKSAETLATSINLHIPSEGALSKSHSQALSVVEELSERAMMDNRKEVTSTLRLQGQTVDGEIPCADVAIDGQFSNRSYHFPTGKSDSVSVPVVEQVTGKGLVVQHVNLSHRDGSLPANIHINSGETLAAQMSYEKTHSTDKYPLHFGVVTTDGDTGLAKALEAGRINQGERRGLKRRGCVFHAESAAKRKFTRESMIKLTVQQKADMYSNQKKGQLPDNLDANTCPACLKSFKNSKGLNIHLRACKGERAEECKIRGLEPLFLQWESKATGEKLTVKDKKLWRDGIRRWVLKRMKTEMNLGIHAQNPLNRTIKDDVSIHDALYLAGRTIVPCLSGTHDACLVDARGCQGPNSPPEYYFLPSNAPLGPIPQPTVTWLYSVVDMLLGKHSLKALVINGKKATTSLVESCHKEIRLPVPKGRVYPKNEARLIKSGVKCKKGEGMT